MVYTTVSKDVTNMVRIDIQTADDLGTVVTRITRTQDGCLKDKAVIKVSSEAYLTNCACILKELGFRIVDRREAI